MFVSSRPWCSHTGADRSGAGKSTLLKLVAGETQPDAGRVTVGPSVELGYFSQHAADQLDGELTVLAQLQQDYPRASQGSLRNLLGAFGFSGDDVDAAMVRRDGLRNPPDPSNRSTAVLGFAMARDPATGCAWIRAHEQRQW